MPWNRTTPMDQKTQFIADYLRRSASITELCTNFGISRKTGYKWIDRYLHDGPQGLEDRSTKPYTAPNRTPAHIVEALIELRRHHPTWGAGKLLAVIERRHRGWELPARSTACEILKRHGLVARKRSRRMIGHPGSPYSLKIRVKRTGGSTPIGALASCTGVWTLIFSLAIASCRRIASSKAGETSLNSINCSPASPTVIVCVIEPALRCRASTS